MALAVNGCAMIAARICMPCSLQAHTQATTLTLAGATTKCAQHSVYTSGETLRLTYTSTITTGDLLLHYTHQHPNTLMNPLQDVINHQL
jgi:hypothetical protein